MNAIMRVPDRGLSSVIGVILMVAVTVIIAAVAGVVALGFVADVQEPAPNVAETSGEFVAGASSDKQIVKISHIGGDDVPVEDIEIIVEAPDCDTEARLVDLPTDGRTARSIDDADIRGDESLISEGYKTARIIVVEDSNVWSVGDTIEFRVATGGCDFRDPNNERLEVTVVHLDSEAILFEDVFRA